MGFYNFAFYIFEIGCNEIGDVVIRKKLLARAVIKDVIDVYNNKRPHLSCEYLTPEQMHNQDKIKRKQWKKKTSKIKTLEV